ncbi:MAG: methyltransferase type 11 [Rhizobiaceae bacterium]|nr:methyltransferase type 11 [Rhizobiaceae bacterium]
MELPPRLRIAIEELLHGVPLAELQGAAARLSQRYRAELRDGKLHLSDETAVKAYLAARMPATFAAIRASFSMLEDTLAEFEPRTMLDVGSGPGTALWAAKQCWPTLSNATMLEASPSAARIGRALASQLVDIAPIWLEADASKALEAVADSDLVTLCYVLDELPPQSSQPLVLQLWALTRSVLVIVEPGTPAGWRRILEARAALVDAGAHIAAPCPHHADCALMAPDWCHFSRRVARSRVHRMTKNAEVPWEDEKYIFIAASRTAPNLPVSRVIAPPLQQKGRLELKLCEPDGHFAFRTISKKDGEAYREARRADWGDGLDITSQ